jgi:transcriptional regulator with XRE-family HTH domain
MSTPGQRIKARRKELGLSQGQLAAMSGIAQSTLSELETGESKLPSSMKLVGLAKALKVSKLWIITGQSGEAEIADDETQELIDMIQTMSAEQRLAVYTVIRSMSKEDK